MATMNIVPPVAPVPQPPAQGGGAGARAQPNPGGPGPPSTFAKLYASLTADVHTGAYKAIQATFLAEPTAACLTPAEIQTLLDNAGSRFLQVFMFLGPDHWTLSIHTVTCYPIVPGVAMQWDGSCFGPWETSWDHLLSPLNSLQLRPLT